MISLYIRSFEQTLHIKTNSSKIYEYIHSLRRIHVFPITILTERDAQNLSKQSPCLVVIDHTSDTFASYDAEAQQVTLSASWNAINNSGTLENFLYQILCLSALENEIYLLHGAAIVGLDQTILILGGLGAGKTSLSTSMCINHGFKWLANDQIGLQVLEDDIFVTHGFDLIDFRKLAFVNLSSHLPPHVRSLIESRFPTIDSPLAKTSPPFQPEELGIVRGLVPARVSYILFPHVLENVTEFGGPMERLLATWSLMQEMARIVRGAEIFIRDNNGSMLAPSISVYPRNGWQHVCRFVNHLVDLYPPHTFYGSINAAQSYLLNLAVSDL